MNERTKPSVVFMFPGQGAQYFQMGRALFQQDELFRSWMLRGSRMAEALTGVSVVEAIYEDRRSKADVFDHTLTTHPAIFIIECAMVALLKSMGIYPDYVFGVSLGEFAACVTAGALTFEEGLHAVVKQAQLVEDCEAGHMLAVLDATECYQTDPEIHQRCTHAGLMFPGHYVLAGLAEPMRAVEEVLKRRDIVAQRLPVSRAFHSPHIEPIASSYQTFLSRLTWKAPAISLVSSLKVEVLVDPPIQYLWEVVRGPMHVQRSIALLESLGPHAYVDVGPSGGLLNYVKYNVSPTSSSSRFPTLSPFGREAATFRGLYAQNDLPSIEAPPKPQPTARLAL